MTTLKFAATQLELRAERSPDEFLAHVGALAKKAAGQGAELIVFPELGSTGLLAAISDHAVTTKTIQSDYWNVLPTFTGDLLAGLKRIAAEHGVIVAGGSHNRMAEDRSLRNTAYLVRPDGRVEPQDKLHLTSQEHDLGARGGDDLLVTTIGPFTAGLLICADIQFPELARYLVHKGADLILCPSLTWNRHGVHRVRTGCQARAIENQLYVVMGVAEGTGEEILLVELDHDLLLASRENPQIPGLKLRRLDLFDKLRSEVT